LSEIQKRGNKGTKKDCNGGRKKKGKSTQFRGNPPKVRGLGTRDFLLGRKEKRDEGRRTKGIRVFFHGREKPRGGKKTRRDPTKARTERRRGVGG